MMKGVRVFLFLVFIFFFHQIIDAQTKQQFLSQVGVLDSIHSEILEESRAIYVQLPTSYNPESGQKYPVVYILDGEVFLPAVNTVHEFYSGGFIPEMILIGISNSTNRVRDLTTSVVKNDDGSPFIAENGGAADFIQFFEEELIPYVEAKYPVTNYRTLIGHSYGGLFTVYTLLNHPDLFANYLAIDPSLDWDDQQLLKQAKDLLTAQEFKGKSLFMSLSGQLHQEKPQVTINNVMQDTSEMTLFSRSNIGFREVIRGNEQNGLNFEWQFYSKDLHGTIPLPSIMDGLLSLFSWFEMEGMDKFNTPSTPHEELANIVRYRAQKLEDHFGYPASPYPDFLFTMLGYMSMDRQQTEKAKMFFEFGIEFFPNSANAYDSMADFYEMQDDRVNALKFVAKAYELSGSDYHKKRIAELSE